MVFLGKFIVGFHVFLIYFANHKLITRHMKPDNLNIADGKVGLPILSGCHGLFVHSFAHICDCYGLAAAQVFMKNHIFGCCYDDYDLCVQKVLSRHFGLLRKHRYDFALHQLFDRHQAEFFTPTIASDIPYFLRSKLQYLPIILGLSYWPLLQIWIPF